jgi:transcriptional regulator of acetoin/glycerol metabolism
VTYRQALQRAGRSVLLKALHSTETVADAARQIDVDRTHFYRLCKRHGVDFPKQRQVFEG